MDELLSDFLSDTAESLDIVEAGLMRLESQPGDTAILTAALRHLHTIKGGCGFLALPRLCTLTETAEGFLIAARADGAILTPHQADAILRGIDRMRGVMSGLKANAKEPAGDDSGLIAEIEAAVSARDTAALPAYDRANAAQPAPRMLRINAEALDALAEIAGELARARNSLAVLTASLDVTGVHAPLDALTKTADDLIALADHLRKRRADDSWRSLPRIARDAAGALGKDIELSFAGEALEFGAPIIDAVKAPLAHLLRNAIAHGIEAPAAREAAGKARAGRIFIAARQDKDEAVFVVADDGVGLDPAFIRKRGIENGMISAAQAARMTDEDAIELLFAPGFSTAQQVSVVSGRGIGLDAVKAAVERLGGRITLETQAGKGAAFSLRFPSRAAPAPRIIVDPHENAHAALAEQFAAAGYAIEHGAAAALLEASQSLPLNEQSA